MSKTATQHKAIDDYTINGVAPLNAGELIQADINQPKRDTRFKKGNQVAKGNRKPRTRLNDRFLADTLALWETHGNQALQAMLERKPEAFCTMVANLLPKHIDVDVTDDTRWVINASPRLSEDEWRSQHGLATTDTDETA